MEGTWKRREDGGVEVIAGRGLPPVRFAIPEVDDEVRLQIGISGVTTLTSSQFHVSYNRIIGRHFAFRACNGGKRMAKRCA